MSPSCVKNPYRGLTGAACRDKVEMENVDARKAEERKDLLVVVEHGLEVTKEADSLDKSRADHGGARNKGQNTE